MSPRIDVFGRFQRRPRKNKTHLARLKVLDETARQSEQAGTNDSITPPPPPPPQTNVDPHHWGLAEGLVRRRRPRVTFSLREESWRVGGKRGSQWVEAMGALGFREEGAERAP